jgi:hypothetical protein
LISGYFCLKTTFKISKLLDLVIETWCYSFGIYILLLATGQIGFGLANSICAFFPILTRQYWFVTTYVGAYICSPIIKIIGNKLSKKEFQLLLGTGFLLLVVYYNFFFFCDNLNFGGATGLPWFVYLYFWGIYFAKFVNIDFKSRHLKNYVIIAVISFLSRIPFYLLYGITYNEIFIKGATIFDSVYNSIFAFLSSLAFFDFFINIKFSSSDMLTKLVLKFSSCAFAVYLIHDNCNLRNALWEMLDYSSVNNGIVLLFYWIGTIFLIYLLCSIVELFRQFIHELTIKKVLTYINIDKRLEHKLNILVQKINTERLT